MIHSHVPRNRRALWVLLWTAGAVGVASLLWASSLLPINAGRQPLGVVIRWYVVPLSVLTVAVSVGVLLAPRVALRAPVSEAVVSGRSVPNSLAPLLLPGLIGGMIGAVAVAVAGVGFRPYLPSEFVDSTSGVRVPLLARVLYGGITEELVVRWGLMTALVWIPYRVFHKCQGEIRTGYFIAAIVLSALLFGAGHLTIAASVVSNLTVPLVSYIVAGNAALGLVAGYLYWRHGLEAAMIAHIITGILIGAA